jgi:hypothetical protein
MAVWAAMPAAVVRSCWSAAQRNPVRKLANSMSTQSTATRWPGPSHAPQWATANCAKLRAGRSRTSPMAPVAASWSWANWRMVSHRL